MKIAIYSPYLDSFGGGERYMLTIAEALSKHHQVDVLLDTHLINYGESKLKDDLSERLNLRLEEVNFISAPVGIGSSGIKRLIFLKQYDCLFYLTDGSIFYSTAKKNILHIQSPLINPKIKSLKNKLKLKSWDMVIYNSLFTKQHAEKYWPLRDVVVYPPVDIENIKALPKKKYILTVGRFFGFLKTKKHDEMIKSFIKMYGENKISDWSLHLVGSASTGDETYINELKEKSKGFPIHFYPNLSFEKLIKLYGEAAIYWHAAGFNEIDPTKMEHFGISTVEAMAAGCVPIVINKGGQSEIVEDGKNGLLWNTLDELIKQTLQVITETNLRKSIALRAIERSKTFSKAAFSAQIRRIVED